MTVALEHEIWIDPSDGYTIRVSRVPYDVETEDGGRLMGFSFHTGKLWCEISGRKQLPRTGVNHDPFSKAVYWSLMNKVRQKLH